MYCKMTAAGGTWSAEKWTGVPKANNKPAKLCNNNAMDHAIMDCHLRCGSLISSVSVYQFCFLLFAVLSLLKLGGVEEMRSIFFRSGMPCIGKYFKCLPNNNQRQSADKVHLLLLQRTQCLQLLHIPHRRSCHRDPSRPGLLYGQQHIPEEKKNILMTSVRV